MMITPELMIAGVILIALMIYTLSAGADFGGGAWTLLASGRRAEDQRQLVDDAIGPIWEANHVWLILVVVLLFVCFPGAFAAVSTALHRTGVFAKAGTITTVALAPATVPASR